jgi:hypothetical protein
VTLDRRSALMGTLALAGSLSAWSRPGRAGPTNAGSAMYWGGINNGTGFFPDDPYLSTCIRATQTLGLKLVRQGMNAVGGFTEGAPFNWARRDNALNRYRAAGIAVCGVLSFREMVKQERQRPTQWQRNFRYFVRNVMWRYRDHVRVWIIDNEPDVPFGDYYPTPAECVAFTRIAWEELHDLGIDDRCQIESPPPASVDAGYMTAMLEAGLAECCHIVGVHCYGAQIIDSRIRKPWERLEALGIRNRAVSTSECGISPNWCPANFPGGVGVWRANFHRQLRVQAKAHGYDYAIMFDLDRWRQREEEFRIATFDSAGTSYAPVQPVWEAVRQSWGTAGKFTNGGFEGAENGLGAWFIRHDPDDVTLREFRYISFPRDAAKARSGSGYCRMSLAGHTNTLVLRQVADQLRPGTTYRVTAHAFLTGGAATMRARGYNRFNGTATMVTSTSTAGSWRTLSLQVVPTNPWIVVELASRGTGRAGQEIRWDDVSVTALAA